jgi:hypothetical protein
VAMKMLFLLFIISACVLAHSDSSRQQVLGHPELRAISLRKGASARNTFVSMLVLCDLNYA